MIDDGNGLMPAFALKADIRKVFTWSNFRVLDLRSFSGLLWVCHYTILKSYLIIQDI